MQIMKKTRHALLQPAVVGSLLQPTVVGNILMQFPLSKVGLIITVLQY